MTKILILTTTYPFGRGEPYIEEEINIWCESGVSVVIAPMATPDGVRATPNAIRVDASAATNMGWSIIRYYIQALFWAYLWREIKKLISVGNTNPYCYAKAIDSAANILKERNSIKYLFNKYDNFNVVYSYWNDIQSYAAATLKKELRFKMISRAHGFDIYKSRRKYEYMPYKAQFINDYDGIYAVSEQGRDYICDTYLPNKPNIGIARLGVIVPSHNAKISNSGCLRIVSVSACVHVKRIDKIIMALEEVFREGTELTVSWVHIGSGPELNDLVRLAEQKLRGKVNFLFLGELCNADVHDYYVREQNDVFINTSDSEGVPFSIMEAMSYGVPAIALNVGGVPELVSNDCGCLLSADSSIKDVAKAIIDFSSRAKNENIRNKAREVIILKYAAVTNYRSFIKEALDE